MTSTELAEMQREWRNATTTAIHDTADKVDKLLDMVQTMRSECAHKSDLADLAKRVGGLEHDRQKILGGAFILNLIGGVILYLYAKFGK